MGVHQMEIRVLVLGAVLIGLMALETRFWLRSPERVLRLKRWVENFIIFLLTVVLGQGLKEFLTPINWNFSLMGLLNETVVTLSCIQWCVEFILLDLYIYFWHVINHKVKYFWRFHQFHHLDSFMDATTALRFHPGELVLSALVKVGVVMLLGISLSVLVVFETCVTLMAIIHHSNVWIPYNVEKWVGFVLVTPRHHQNHHSWILKETDSNYSVIFSFWDRLFRTRSEWVDPILVTIGVPTHPESFKMNLWSQLKVGWQKVLPWPEDWLRRKNESHQVK
jgi:sterol desaturase/sphingolipid hydroxylase (fatty acid hydroxylase superfamily)